MHQRDIAFRNARRLKTPESWALARAFRSRVSSGIRKAKRGFICRQIYIADGESQKFWRIKNDAFFKTTERKIGEIIDPENGDLVHGKYAADMVNRYFCNISNRLANQF